ncbi:bacteriocin [Bacteroides sp. 51]|nr:bacteriocin [Bacteroides sp. 51]NDV82103.1 bacteriocin [Bacteroides sp. 51]
MITNLNENELKEINGGFPLIPVITLTLAAIAIDVEIMKFCYDIGKD